MILSYPQAVEKLYGRINYERLGTEQYSSNDLKLERMRLLLEAIGEPHKKIPVVHVAGTKGKGTTCTLIARMLQQAGYRVGLYTSPHMHRIEERFTINGHSPAPEEFARLVAELLPIVAQFDQRGATSGPTFFECVNALAWQYFEQQEVDIAVLEVGLGGRLDSTNLCQPLVTAITSISYDHTRILGNTLEQIAGEKAGIIKSGIPVICGVEAGPAQTRIHRQAAERQAEVRQLHHDFTFSIPSPWTWDNKEQAVSVQTSLSAPQTAQEKISFTLNQPGPIYAQNAALAIACLRELQPHGFVVSPAQIQQALQRVELPLRFEILAESPVLIADSAHNPASLRALVQTLRTVFPQRPLTFLLAVSRDKDYAACCRELQGIDRVIATSFLGNERALSHTQLQQTLQQEYAGEILAAASPAEALQLARQRAVPQEILVATGSLFFAADLRKLIHETAPQQLVQNFA